MRAGAAQRLLVLVDRQHDRRTSAGRPQRCQNAPIEVDFGLRHLAPQRPRARHVGEFLDLHAELDARRPAGLVAQGDGYRVIAFGQDAMRQQCLDNRWRARRPNRERRPVRRAAASRNRRARSACRRWRFRSPQRRLWPAPSRRFRDCREPARSTAPSIRCGRVEVQLAVGIAARLARRGTAAPRWRRPERVRPRCIRRPRHIRSGDSCSPVDGFSGLLRQTRSPVCRAWGRPGNRLPTSGRSRPSSAWPIFFAVEEHRDSL